MTIKMHKNPIVVRLFQCFFGVIMLASCVSPESKESSKTSNKEVLAFAEGDSLKMEEGLTILHEGPRGGGYKTSRGDVKRYTVYRVQLSNDFPKDLELNLNLPNQGVKLQPGSSIDLDVFLIPKNFTPNHVKDTFNFGVKMEDFFESGSAPLLMLSQTIPAREKQAIYIAVVLKNDPPNGMTRTKLFLEGGGSEAPFYGVRSESKYPLDDMGTNLYFGISIDPPNNYAVIPCGRISF